MTGRDLIIYILQNNLEDEEIFKNGKIIGFLTTEEVAVLLKVGIETVKVAIELGFLEGVIQVGNEFLIPEESVKKITK